MDRKTLLRPTLLLGVALAAGATAALAGNGVGGVFNLGQINNVSRTTELRGTTTTQQLLVRNNATGGTSSAVVGLSVQGIGVWGRSNRAGVRGSASAATGFTYGVYGSSASTEGRGGVFVATGASGFNYGIYGGAASPDGFAGYFENLSTSANPQSGRGIRSLAAGASAPCSTPATARPAASSRARTARSALRRTRPAPALWDGPTSARTDSPAISGTRGIFRRGSSGGSRLGRGPQIRQAIPESHQSTVDGGGVHRASSA